MIIIWMTIPRTSISILFNSLFLSFHHHLFNNLQQGNLIFPKQSIKSREPFGKFYSKLNCENCHLRYVFELCLAVMNLDRRFLLFIPTRKTKTKSHVNCYLITLRSVIWSSRSSLSKPGKRLENSTISCTVNIVISVMCRNRTSLASSPSVGSDYIF